MTTLANSYSTRKRHRQNERRRERRRRNKSTFNVAEYAARLPPSYITQTPQGEQQLTVRYARDKVKAAVRDKLLSAHQGRVGEYIAGRFHSHACWLSRKKLIKAFRGDLSKATIDRALAACEGLIWITIRGCRLIVDGEERPGDSFRWLIVPGMTTTFPGQARQLRIVHTGTGTPEPQRDLLRHAQLREVPARQSVSVSTDQQQESSSTTAPAVVATVSTVADASAKAPAERWSSGRSADTSGADPVMRFGPMKGTKLSLLKERELNHWLSQPWVYDPGRREMRAELDKRLSGGSTAPFTNTSGTRTSPLPRNCTHTPVCADELTCSAKILAAGREAADRAKQPSPLKQPCTHTPACYDVWQCVVERARDRGESPRP